MEYKVVFSKRKTLNITVERDRSIVVRAPENLSRERIEQIVYSKRQWINAKMNHAQKYPVDIQPKEFISGESLMYLGKNYQLQVVDEPLEGVQFNHKFKISKSEQTQANQLFKQWYLRKALEKIQPVAKRYAQNLGVEFNECKTSEMKYRWGSCTPNNNIIFNWRIIKAPMFVVEYLVAHELVHLIESNHTAKFWHILSVQIPNYQRAKKWLKEKGYVLEIDF